MLVDLNNANNYLQVINFKEYKLDEFKSNDQMNRFYPCNGLTTAIDRPDGTSASLNYVEPRYLQVSAQEAGGSESIITQQVQFKLKDIMNTFFAINKDVVFPEVLMLRLVWEAGNRISWYANSATDPNTGATASTGNHTASNVCLFLAVEQNQEIANSLQAKIASSGLNIPIDYVHSYKTNLSSTSQTVSLKFNAGHGQTLKKVIHAAFANTETTWYAYDHVNTSQSKISSFYSMLDNERLQEINLTCSTYDDYLFLKKQLAGTPIMNANIYNANWFWCDDWSDRIDNKNVVAGLPISGTEHKWDIYMTTANANHNHYTFAVCQKILSIGPNLIEVK